MQSVLLAEILHSQPAHCYLVNNCFNMLAMCGLAMQDCSEQYTLHPFITIYFEEMFFLLLVEYVSVPL